MAPNRRAPTRPVGLPFPIGENTLLMKPAVRLAPQRNGSRSSTQLRGCKTQNYERLPDLMTLQLHRLLRLESEQTRASKQTRNASQAALRGPIPF